jgi:hypothetical protein
VGGGGGGRGRGGGCPHIRGGTAAPHSRHLGNYFQLIVSVVVTPHFTYCSQRFQAFSSRVLMSLTIFRDTYFIYSLKGIGSLDGLGSC